MVIKDNNDFTGRHVLAVEDSMVQAKQIKRFFELNHIPAIVCRNGSEALASLKERRPMLIISDVIMPVMDGYTLCANVKSDPLLKSIPVILLTSLSDPLDIIKGLQAGADSFITKPYNHEHLLTRIFDLVENYAHNSVSSDDAVDIVFQNQRFPIHADKRQVLNLLLSVYEDAMGRNAQLIETQRQLEVMNENLKAANSELEAFSSTVSHDLKTPLTGVIGYAELLTELLKDHHDPSIIDYLNSIIRSGTKMAKLINDLLAFSRSGRSALTPKDVDLAAMAREIITDLTEIAYKHDYQVHIQKDMQVSADPALIRIVLTNLLENALKYSQHSQRPAISFICQEVGQRRVFCVRDNGVGFDMAKADDLFRPFIRLHDKSQFKGTGVGLSTVKRIIERHNGSIWFDSTSGSGSSFYFTLNE